METRESGKWIDHDKCMMTVEEKKDIQFEGKVVGNSVQTLNIEASYDDLIAGVNMKNEAIRKNEAAVVNYQETIVSLGELPEKDEFVLKVEQAISLSEKLKQKKDAELAIMKAENEISKDKSFVENRMKIIEQRPE